MKGRFGPSNENVLPPSSKLAVPCAMAGEIGLVTCIKVGSTLGRLETREPVSECEYDVLEIGLGKCGTPPNTFGLTGAMVVVTGREVMTGVVVTVVVTVTGALVVLDVVSDLFRVRLLCGGDTSSSSLTDVFRASCWLDNFPLRVLRSLSREPALDFLGLACTATASVSLDGVEELVFTILDIIPSSDVGNATCVVTGTVIDAWPSGRGENSSDVGFPINDAGLLVADVGLFTTGDTSGTATGVTVALGFSVFSADRESLSED